MGLTNVSFYCNDIREVAFHDEFDVVFNLADGAIGYLENEEREFEDFRYCLQGTKGWRPACV